MDLEEFKEVFESTQEPIELLEYETKNLSDISLLYTVNPVFCWSSGKYPSNKEAADFLEKEVEKVQDLASEELGYNYDELLDKDDEEKLEEVDVYVMEYFGEEDYYISLETELDWDKLTISARITDAYNYTKFEFPEKVIKMKHISDEEIIEEVGEYIKNNF